MVRGQRTKNIRKKTVQRKTATKPGQISSVYDPQKIEPILQKKWEEEKPYKALASAKTKKKPFYVLSMFPYPSGSGLHIGHPRSYTATDIVARKKRMEGYNVLNPMGYDAFGLPAEQFAIQNKVHPKKAVALNVATFERQLKKLGFSFDWDRKINTTDPEYYRWTQWIFLKLYNSYYDTKKKRALPIEDLIKTFNKKGTQGVSAFTSSQPDHFSKEEWLARTPLQKQETLMQYRLAYEGEAEVNWCEELGTVLANDEIVDGKDGPVSERGGYPVTKKNIRQWFLRITAYADRLLSGLDQITWPEHIKEIEKNWIGKSEGSEITFTLNVPGQTEGKHSVTVFTTRADTLFGATFLAISAELADTWLKVGWNTDKKVISYIRDTIKEHQRNTFDVAQDKTGIFTGIYAIHPGTQEKIPVWIANYVLPGYGTGAIMGVPAHDERDFEFAKKYNLPIIQVVAMETGIRRENEEFKDGGAGVVFDPKTQKYAIGLFPNGKPLLFAGGVNKGERVYDAILREVQEESGLHNFKHIEHMGVSYAHYFNTAKQVNRVARAECLLIILENTDIKKHAREDHEQFELAWMSAQEIRAWWVANDKSDDFKHYIRFLDEAVGRAIELGYDITSDPQIFKRTPITGDGILENSGKFDGLTSQQAKVQITRAVGGKLVTRYKMRDAIFARQRYWGEPIPLYKNKDGLLHEVKKLPLSLPNTTSYEPTGTGEGPLANISSWKKAGYETNTMPGWAGSSWYHLRYMDALNKKEFAGKKEVEYWKNVDVYLGGAEHATGHLLYSRFWHKVLKDYGLVKTEEPFKQLVTHGLILAKDGRKMSKRWGNTVNPDDVVAQYGADTTRLYIAFMGPYGESIPWSDESIIGCRRFIERLYRKATKVNEENVSTTNKDALKAIHKLVDKISTDIASYSFNTAVAKAMETMNVIDTLSVSKKNFSIVLQVLNPFIPHVTECLWDYLKNKENIHTVLWPKPNKKLLIEDTVTIGVQINGKLRSTITVANNSSEDVVKEAAQKEENVVKYLDGKRIVKIIYVPNRIINIVVAP